MSLRYAVAVSLLPALLLGLAAPVPAAEPAPVLRVINPEIDLGTQKSGPLMWFGFKLRNEGTAPLQIKDIQVSCGCMAVQSEKTILPGKQITLWVKMTTRGQDGPVAKYVRLTTNDPQAPAVALGARANLLAPIHVAPTRTVVLNVRKGQEASNEVTLESRESSPLEITGVESTPSSVHAEVLPVAGNPHVRKLRLTLAAADARPFDGSVAVHTNSKELPLIHLTLAAIAQGTVVVMPPRLYFTPVYEEMPQPAERVITLMRQERPFQVLSVKSDDPALQVQVLHPEKASSAEVQVTYRGGWKPGKLEGKITLTVSDSDWPEIEVPYSCEVQAGKAPDASGKVAASGGASDSARLPDGHTPEPGIRTLP